MAGRFFKNPTGSPQESKAESEHFSFGSFAPNPANYLGIEVAEPDFKSCKASKLFFDTAFQPIHGANRLPYGYSQWIYETAGDSGYGFSWNESTNLVSEIARETSAKARLESHHDHLGMAVAWRLFRGEASDNAGISASMKWPGHRGAELGSSTICVFIWLMQPWL